MPADAYFDKYVIEDFGAWRLYLHEQQYYLGRVYLWATEDGPIDLYERSAHEYQQLRLATNLTKAALTKLFQPDRFNYATLANVAEHCHQHIIPRYREHREYLGMIFRDERWGANWAPYPKMQLPEQVLFTLRDAIKANIKQ